MKSLPTKRELDDELLYDPITGKFSWKRLGTGRKVEVGSVDKLGYLRIQVNKRRHLAHVLAWIMMTGKCPKYTVDHRNRNPEDNRWSNLREATMTEQTRNRERTPPKFTNVKGVYKRGNKYRAAIRIDGILVQLGTYKTIDEAIAVRQASAIQHFQEFHCEKLSKTNS